MLLKDHFPTPGDVEACKAWRPYRTWSALATTVLCAATTRIEGTWTAYCRDVPGIRHDAEVEDVFEWGDKLPERIARAIFPVFEGVPYDG